MIVECPACHIRYRTQVLGAVDETTFFECTQTGCRHVFQSTPPVVQIEMFSDADNRSEAQLASKPTFIHESRSFDSTDEIATSAAARPGNGIAARNGLTDGNSLSLFQKPPPRNGTDDSAVYTTKAEANDSRSLRFDPVVDAALDEHVVSHRSLMTFLGLILAGWTLVTLIAVSNIAETSAAMSRVPLLGRLLDAERPSARHVALTKMRGNFWRTKDGHDIFAIAGTAHNEARVSAYSIHIEGRLLNTDGRVLEQRVIRCGTETAPEVLESLTLREVRILQSLAPPNRFVVPAGHGADFLIAFLDPPDHVAEFSGRVVATRFGRAEAGSESEWHY